MRASLGRTAVADTTVAATNMATTLRFRDAPSANSESSGDAGFVLVRTAESPLVLRGADGGAAGF